MVDSAYLVRAAHRVIPIKHNFGYYSNSTNETLKTKNNNIFMENCETSETTAKPSDVETRTCKTHTHTHLGHTWDTYTKILDVVTL